MNAIHFSISTLSATLVILAVTIRYVFIYLYNKIDKDVSHINRDIKKIEESTASNILKYYTTNKNFFIGVNKRLDNLEEEINELKQNNKK